MGSRLPRLPKCLSTSWASPPLWARSAAVRVHATRRCGRRASAMTILPATAPWRCWIPSCPAGLSSATAPHWPCRSPAGPFSLPWASPQSPSRPRAGRCAAPVWIGACAARIWPASSAPPFSITFWRANGQGGCLKAERSNFRRLVGWPSPTASSSHKKRRPRWRGRLSSGTKERTLFGRLQVDLALGELSQLLVGRLLLVQVLLKDGSAVAAAELLGPLDQRAVAGNLIVLHGPGGGDQRCVEHLLVVDLAGYVAGLLKDAVDCRAVDLLGFDAVHLEHLLDPLDVAAGLLEMQLEALFQLWIGCLFDHVRQRFLDLLLRIIDVL